MATKMKYMLQAVHPPNPEDGDLCVWNMTDPPRTISRYAVKDLAEAKQLIAKLIKEQRDDSITMNAFGLEQYDMDLGQWLEWEHPDTGNDITDTMDAEDEAEQNKADAASEAEAS